MPKLTMSAAFAAILAASMPAALAQTTNANPPPPAPNAANVPATPAEGMPNHVMPGQLRFSDMNGATVYDGQNNNVGDINNVVLDRDGKVAAVVVKTGAFLGIGGKTVALSMKDIKVATDKDGKPRFTVDMTKDQLKAAQNYDVNPPSNNARASNPPAGNATGSSMPPVRSNPTNGK